MAAKVSSSGSLPGHEWQGWTPIRDLDDTTRDRLVDLLTPRVGTPALPNHEAILDGRVPLCSCGWSGDPVTWRPSSDPRRRSSEWRDHISWTRVNVAGLELGASMASAALNLAADDWSGDSAFADHLRSRAEHIDEAGIFDGKQWPRMN